MTSTSRGAKFNKSMTLHALKHPPHDPRRDSVRYSTQLRVRFGQSQPIQAAPVANLSEGGLCIRTNDVLKTGSLIVLALEIGGREIRLTGEVMWAIRVPEHQTEFMEHGMGVQFLDAGPDWKRAFARWKDVL